MNRLLSRNRIFPLAIVLATVFYNAVSPLPALAQSKGANDAPALTTKVVKQLTQIAQENLSYSVIKPSKRVEIPEEYIGKMRLAVYKTDGLVKFLNQSKNLATPKEIDAFFAKNTFDNQSLTQA